MRPKQIIIEIGGGLGNQMFQYAFYLNMKHLGYNCKLYFDEINQMHQGFELQNVFDIDIKFANKSEVEKLLDIKKDLLSKLNRRIFGQKQFIYWEHNNGYAFKPEIVRQQKPAYLQGCWLSEKYFEDIKAEVRQAFRFKELNKKNQYFFNQINGEKNAVSIHIRKGDYLKSAIHLNVDYHSYVSQAISYLLQSRTGLSFYVFSDDIRLAREILSEYETIGSKFHFVNWNLDKESYIDMQLMANCKHNIIANSTFSWWGAWLNNYEEKIVISPKNWFAVNEWNNNSIIPDSWIVI
jgi:hypothetical protein